MLVIDRDALLPGGRQYTVWQVQASKQPRSCWVAGPSADTKQQCSSHGCTHLCSACLKAWQCVAQRD